MGRITDNHKYIYTYVKIDFSTEVHHLHIGLIEVELADLLLGDDGCKTIFSSKVRF